jgi:hypothetical protein
MIEIKKANKNDKDILLLFRYLLHTYEANIEKSDKFDFRMMQNDKRAMLKDLENKTVYFFIA